MRSESRPRFDPRSMVIFLVFVLLLALAVWWLHRHSQNSHRETHPVVLGPPKSEK